MILNKDQLYRYMRQIAIPEISKQGQEKILGSRVFLFGENLDGVALALYYLAAAGVGEVYCSIDSAHNWKSFSDKLTDLNSDCKILFQYEGTIESTSSQHTTRIIAGSSGYVEKTMKTIAKADYVGTYIPTIAAIYSDWHGVVQTFTEEAAMKDFLSELNASWYQDNINTDDCPHKLSGYFSSLLAVIEHLKLTLSLGKPLSSPLYHNLYTMEFEAMENCSDLLHKLNTPVRMPELKQSLFADSKILIAGCGGPGSAAAFALTTLGIERLGLLDPDTVELSNLNRQIMHSTSRVGKPKVQSSEIFLRQINPDIKLDIYGTNLEKESIQAVISSYDIIIGCFENPKDIYILNDACVAAEKPLLQAGALDISALVTSIIPGEGHFYRCIFPESEAGSALSSCSEKGVLGPVPGLMGIVQSAEAVKLLTGIGRSLRNKLLLFDVFDTDIYITDNRENRYYELCAK